MIWDFAAILTLLVLVSGAIWAGDSLLFAPRRARTTVAAADPPPLPWLVDYAKSFFPIFLVVLLLRSFVSSRFASPRAR